MKRLKDLFLGIKNLFTIRKRVEFPGVVIEMEPLTTQEELKVLEACKDYDKSSYIEELKKCTLAYSIKKINEVVLEEDLEYEGDNGEIVKESKYLFILRQLDTWPSAIRDVVFDAFNNMLLELEDKVSKQAKFERFEPPQVPIVPVKNEPVIPEGFKKIEEPVEENQS